MRDFFIGIGGGIVQFFEQAWAVLRSFEVFPDLFDILLVALMIYGLIRLLRETRGVQLLKGLFWLVVVAGAAYLFGMQASWYIFDQAMSSAIVLLMILFQPEIRAVFERLGRSNVTNLNIFAQPTRAEQDRKATEQAIHQVCEACRQFCKDRTGALIVFERVTMLGDTIKSGTLIDARVSRALVSNIFYNMAPLHDGAVIIRKGRLEAAGCILPLTKNLEMESAFGTRHRAAVGLSEQSDAMVVVVSEESGQLSLAEKGVLKRQITPDELGGRLRDVLLEQDAKKKRFSLKGRKEAK